jgi:cytochrome c6
LKKEERMKLSSFFFRSNFLTNKMNKIFWGLVFLTLETINGADLKKNWETGEKLFQFNCSVCHPNGKNIMIPEKSLELQSLNANGMTSISSITYQVTNGKNGMPAFGDRLSQKEIEKIAHYILFESVKNFEK